MEKVYFDDDPEVGSVAGNGAILEEGECDEEQGMFEHFRLNVDKGQNPMRVDKYMATHLEDTSRFGWIQLSL